MVLAIRIKLTVNERSCHSADYFHPGCYASHYLGQFSVKVKGEKKAWPREKARQEIFKHCIFKHCTVLMDLPR